jgi:hypothetical protein
MNKITFALKSGMKGPRVGDLQAALQLLLDRGVILASDEASRQKLSAALQREHAKQTYGSATRKLVSIFQEERYLEVSGSMDEPTAKRLNRLLDELRRADGKQPEFVVKGAVRFFDGFPAAGLNVSAFDRDLRTEQLLGRSQTNRDGSYRIQYSAGEFAKADTRSADLAVKVFAADGSLLSASPKELGVRS